MSGINKAILIGNLGADPEQRRTQGGTLVANLRVATTEVWTDQETRERKDQTEWHRVVLFGRLAEIAIEYLRKGSQVYIEGRIHTNKWQDTRTGQDRYTTEIIARELKMLGRRPEGEAANIAAHKIPDIVNHPTTTTVNPAVHHQQNRKECRMSLTIRWMIFRGDTSLVI